MKYLLEIAKAIATKKENIQQITQEKKSEIETEVNEISDKDIDKIIAHLFPRIPVNTDFYNTLQKFQHNIGYGPAFHALVGRIWAIAYTKIEKDKQKILLDSLFDKNTRGVWGMIFCLPEFCSRIEIEAQFAAGWFYRFGEIVKDDMANWDFFNGVKNYAFHFPASGMKVFETYITEQLDELRSSLAALILGAVRSKAVGGEYEKDIVNRWDDQLLTSPEVNMRLVYHRSLPVFYDMSSMPIEDLDSKLTKLLKGEPEEVSEAFSVIWRCLRGERADGHFMKFSMNWFSKNVSSELPDGAKYHIVNAMWYFNTPGKQKIDIKSSEADDLLVAIQPIPENNHGTWNCFEMYLGERLEQDIVAFERLLERLVAVNPKGMIAKFKDDAFDHIKTQICQSKTKEFITNWSLSMDANKRKIAGAIMQKSDSVVFSQDVIDEADEKQLEVALMELIRKPLIEAEKTSEYLLALEPAFRNVRSKLKQFFKNEMILQAINYPGACLENWEKIENPSDLLKEIIANAKKYFEGLNAVKGSPAVSFTFSGCKEAADREANEFSNKISRESKEKSIFAQLVKNIHIVYGSRWAVMTADGKLGEATDFQEFGHSVEFPRYEIIDPEGMALRRIQIVNRCEETEDE
jgi:hypothetical protein